MAVHCILSADQWFNFHHTLLWDFVHDKKASVLPFTQHSTIRYHARTDYWKIYRRLKD